MEQRPYTLQCQEGRGYQEGKGKYSWERTPHSTTSYLVHAHTLALPCAISLIPHTQQTRIVAIMQVRLGK